LYLLGFGAMVFILSTKSNEYMENGLKFEAAYWIFIVLTGVVTLFSVQIIYCLLQWDMFRTKQKNVFSFLGSFDGPSFWNWKFEEMYIAIMYIGLLVAKELTGKVWTEHILRICEGCDGKALKMCSLQAQRAQEGLLPWFLSNYEYVFWLSIIITIICWLASMWKACHFRDGKTFFRGKIKD
jgi:hypothetical protein